MALPKAKQDVTDQLMAHIPFEEGTGWLARARSAARERVLRMGLPIGRDEYWRYTDPSGFTATQPAFASSTALPDVFDGVDAQTLTFVDGVFDPERSDALDGIELLSAAGALDIHWAQDTYGELEILSQTPVDRPFAALNTQMADEGVLIHVTGKTSRPLRVRYVSNGGQPSMHHVIKLDPGASLTLLEEGHAGTRSNIAMEVDAGDGAEFNHIRVLPPLQERQALAQGFFRLGKESKVASFGLSLDGAMTRTESYLVFAGDDAAAHIGGACIGDGTDFHHDDTVFVTHDAVNCESRQVFKKVLKNGATGVFQGKILVQPDAQKTDGYQISQGLLLDEDAQFLAKPELEIYADDVACSHGSTCGSVDETQLFYLTSRGIPKAQAENMLVLSFLAEALDEIADEDLSEILATRLEAWLDDR